MKRHIPGPHARQQEHDSLLEGLLLVRVDSACYRWHPQKPFLSLRFVIVEPEPFVGQFLSGRLYSQDQVDEKAFLKLHGVVRTSRVNLNGRSFQNLEAFAPAAHWEELSCETVSRKLPQGNDDGF
jgi:hypothetical protein